jgi:DNA repair protein RadA/Sms
MRIGEVGVDLSLCLSLYSARINQPIPSRTAAAGEISLAGEVHPIGHLDRRIKAVQEMGFSRFICPPSKDDKLKLPPFCFPISSLSEAARTGFQQ